MNNLNLLRSQHYLDFAAELATCDYKVAAALRQDPPTLLQSSVLSMDSKRFRFEKLRIPVVNIIIFCRKPTPTQ